jgi:hypothetical protein
LKFKFIFILFNSIIAFFLFFVFFMPFFMFGADFGLSFWRAGWYLAVILLAILLGINVYYFRNRRLFLLLEREDWPALVHYLEGRVIRGGNYRSALVRLLANTYLVLSDSASIMTLENKVTLAKPSLINANALIFGTARILGKDIAGAVRFFSQRLGPGKNESPEWVRWYYGFSLLLDRQFQAAGDQFIPLAHESKDGILTGLSGFFLADTLPKVLPSRKDAFLAAAEDGRNRVLRSFPVRAAWEKESAKVQTEMYAAVLTRYIKGAAVWLYGGGL